MKTDIKKQFKHCKELASDKNSYISMLKYKNIDVNYVAKLPNDVYNDLVNEFLIPTTWQLHRIIQKNV